MEAYLKAVLLDGTVEDLCSLLSSQPQLLQTYFPPNNDSLLSLLLKQSCDDARHSEADIEPKLKLLLHFKDISLTHRNSQGRYPVHEAVTRPACLQLLCEAGSEPDALKHGDWTPLMLAAHKLLDQSVEILLSFGADPSRTARDGFTAFHMSLQNPALLSHVDPTSRILRERFGVAGILLEAAPEVWQLCARNGRSPVFTAAAHGHADLVFYLLDLISASAVSRYPRNLGWKEHGMGLIGYAVQSGQVDFVEALCKKYPLPMDEGNPLHVAAELGDRKMIELLLLLGAKPAWVNVQGRTAAELAYKNGYYEIASLLRGHESTGLPGHLLSEMDSDTVPEAEFLVFEKPKRTAKVASITEKTVVCDISPEGSSVATDIRGKSATFADLGLSSWQLEILKALAMTTPTPIQTGCIPAILSGRNVVASAPTGSGKTAAFALPLLHILSKDLFGIFALILTPTRELALQMEEQFKALGRGINPRISVVLGGMDMMKQAIELTKKPHIVIATPGRLADLIESSSDSISLRQLRFVVLDEADQLLTGNFGDAMETIMNAVPHHVQTLLFSATTDEPVERYHRLGTNPLVLRLNAKFGTVEKILQKYLFVPSKVRDSYLVHLLQTDFKDKSGIIIFVGKCKTCELMKVMLKALHFQVTALHSQLSQAERSSSLAKFKSARVPILLTTDVGSRGLDIPAVQVVINFDVPADARDYVHRIGRAARAGRGGLALTIMTELDLDLVQNIESKIGKQLEEYEAIPDETILGILNKVSKAKREASMSLTDYRFGEKRDRNKKKHSTILGGASKKRFGRPT